MINGDLLEGAGPLCRFLYADDSPKRRRRIYYWMEVIEGKVSANVKAADVPPLLTIGGVVCGRKSVLTEWMAERERASGLRIARSDEAL